MYHKIVWFYVFVLTFLDITLNSKLSAQGKSHDVQIHDTLVEGISFQDWGNEVPEGGGRSRAAEGVILSPPSLQFGRAPLAVPHTRSVMLTNAANATLHLASVAGTTPDFHASFFESKTLPPQANTTFSVVYLGRREGPVSAHLYIHTSLGVYKYPVSAIGVPSEWGVWPLVGVRVPLNATLDPMLTMYNPTDETVQVSEVYSSGAWLGLQLPEGGRWAARDRWTLPPHTTRDIVRLRLRPHTVQTHHNHPLTAYIRIKANMTGGGLVVGVEARGAPPGEYVSPVHLPLSARGSRDPPDTFSVDAGNSLDESVPLEGGVWGARCSATPVAPPSPPPVQSLASPTHNGHQEHNGGETGIGGGGGSEGVHVSVVRAYLDAHQPPIHAAQITLDYSQMWEAYGGGASGVAGVEEAWCAGWAKVGRAALPYSLRLLPGTLVLLPDKLHFISSSVEGKRAREVRVRNEFPVPVRVAHVHCPPSLLEHFHCEGLTPLVVSSSEEAIVARLRLRSSTPESATVSTQLTIRTNLTNYRLPLLLYSGKLDLEWEWPNSEDGTLRVGAVGTSSTRRVGLRLINRGPARLCVTSMVADLAGAHTAIAACAHLRPLVPDQHPCRCVNAGEWAQAWVTVVAPARAGPVRGALHVHTDHANTHSQMHLHAYSGRLVAKPLRLPPAAPYAWSSAPVVVESTMSLRMRLLNVTQPAQDPALTWQFGEEGSGEEEGFVAAGISSGQHTVAEVIYKPENLCQPDCYTGLDLNMPEGSAWVRRGEEGELALAADAALQVARYKLYERTAHAHDNLSLYLHTDQMVQIPVSGAIERWWPRLSAVARAGDAGLSAVGAGLSYRVNVRNPSRSHALILQAVLSHDHHHLGGKGEDAGVDVEACVSERCVWSRDAFQVSGWSATRGAVREHVPPPAANANASQALPTLLVPPLGELDIKVTFTPKEPALLAAYLYLRNNLTILEAVRLWGRGAYPSFELGGRRPGTNAPILFEVRECGEGGSESGLVRRTVVARNTGPVTVRLRDWRLAGVPCQARGFRLQPCGPLTLAPNESRALHLAFSPDYSLARVPCRLRLRAGPSSAEFALLALAPASLLPRCAPNAHRPPFEPALRAAGTLLALLGLALVLAAAAIDAERELRRSRPHRTRPPTARAPLDLRALAIAQPATHPSPTSVTPSRAPPARRRRPPRRPPPLGDARADRKAFERWRDRILRDADDDDSRSSEDLDVEPDRCAPLRTDDTEPADENDLTHHFEDLDDDEDYEERPTDEPDEDHADGYEADPETEERPHGLGDEDAISTDSASASTASSTPADEPDDHCDDQDLGDGRDSPGIEDHPTVSPPEPGLRFAESETRVTRGRGEATGVRRVRMDAEGGSRNRIARQPSRRDKGMRRRSDRVVSPARSSPASNSAEARAPSLRWGAATWSSVVAAGGTAGAGVGPTAAVSGVTGGTGVRTPLPPIGSDVRRRAATDNSLFFFNGDGARHESEYTWRSPPDYCDDGSSAFRPLSSAVWGGPGTGSGSVVGDAWSGWGGALRPPPGFPPAPPVAPARVYDPFHSLSAIWAPNNVLHWNDTVPTTTSTTGPVITTTNVDEPGRESPR